MIDEEIEIKLRYFISKIEDWLIYYPLKELRLKRIHAATVKTLKYCIVLDYMGLPVNSVMISHFSKDHPIGILNRLHMLASKRVLFLKGYGRQDILMYQLHPDFIEVLKIGILDEITDWREDYIVKHKQLIEGD